MITIASAACKHPFTDRIVTGESHYHAWVRMFPDRTIHQIAVLTNFDHNPCLEGFCTNGGTFVSRQEALRIAAEARQVNLRGGMLWRNDRGDAILQSEATIYLPAA